MTKQPKPLLKFILITLSFLAIVAIVFYYKTRQIPVSQLLKPIGMFTNTNGAKGRAQKQVAGVEFELFAENERAFIVDEEKVYCGAPSLGAQGYKGDYNLKLLKGDGIVNFGTLELVEGTPHDGKIYTYALNDATYLAGIYAYDSCASEKLFMATVDTKTNKLQQLKLKEKSGAISNSVCIDLAQLATPSTLPINADGTLVSLCTDEETGLKVTRSFKYKVETGFFEEL